MVADSMSFKAMRIRTQQIVTAALPPIEMDEDLSSAADISDEP